MDFCLENAVTNGRNLDYVLWLSMVMSVQILLSIIYFEAFVIFFQRHLLAFQPKFVEFV